MGSLDGAEVCELVGLFILDKLTNASPTRTSAYTGTTALQYSEIWAPEPRKKIKKRFMLCFEDIELKITVQSNIKVVNYPDITLNLSNGKFYPYRKPNDKPLYINTRSNYPPSIIKQLPSGINKRISSFSCNAEEFEKAIPAYNDALQKSGFTQRQAFNDKINTDTEKSKKKSRHHNIRWFNPPYSESVQTNVGQKILKLVDMHFPKGHILHKIFNRNTIKVSYSCMGNMKSLINRHNAKILQAEAPTEAKGCNCRKNSTCPLNRACLTESLVYKETVLAENHEPQTYIGMTEHNFKTRFRNHKMSFENPNYRSSTTLSKYIWDLKEDNNNNNKIDIL